MGKALYRKYRSKSLDEIVGQSHITDILKRAIENDKVAHAYLLTGPRGVGKTSIARILAHEINSLPYTEDTTHLDIIEIDAASNNSVEDIRDLREKTMIAPSSAKKKIYIIDEVHMLSKSAFNALLKTLEEPPGHVVFILATTDVEKLPATILSRVQRFNFRSISEATAAMHLRTIADAENIPITDEALLLIARHGKGSFRDSISLLDQLQSISDDSITPDLIQHILGLSSDETVKQIIDAYISGDAHTIIRLVTTEEASGGTASLLGEQLVHAVRARLLESPAMIQLFDRLAGIGRVPWPYVALLNALIPPISQAPAASSPDTIPKNTSRDPKPMQKTQSAKPVSSPATAPKSPPITSVTSDEPMHLVGKDFPWQELITGIKESSIGTFTLLSACDYDFDGSTLTIFAGKKFKKAKLDRALPEINLALQQLGLDDSTISILETPKPPSDSQAAAIIAMMGGGEEVNL